MTQNTEDKPKCLFDCTDIEDMRIFVKHYNPNIHQLHQMMAMAYNAGYTSVAKYLHKQIRKLDDHRE